MTDMKALLDIMAKLRDPNGGCPWDLEQDFSTISPHTIEEAYEVDEAIASGDPEALRDELGDLLFQVVFQARIAEERGLFDFAGVVDAIATKLVRRHPHVFADAATPGSAEDQVRNWEAIKAEERAAAGSGERAADPFVGIPRSLPALARAAKIAGRLSRLAPDVAASSGAPVARSELVRSLEQAIEPVRRTLEQENGSEPERAEALAWVGRGLRAWVWVARALGVDPEQALRSVDDAAMSAAREKRPADSP